MKRFAFVLSLVSLLSACNRGGEEPVTATAPRTRVAINEKARDVDGDNLLNVASGASVVSRSGELNLELSAAHAIDGLASSRWTSPPGGPSQTMVFSLGAPSRITRIGFLVSASPAEVPASIHFDASTDGTSWKRAGTMTPIPSVDPQGMDVEPFEARFVRVRIEEPVEYYANVGTIQLMGKETAPPSSTTLAGCWTINGLDAQIVQNGTLLSGVIETKPPTRLEGGIDGRVARLMWLRGPVWGHAFVTATPDSARLTGITFFQHYIPYNMGDAWFGERKACAAPSVPDAAADLFAMVGRLRLYGLAFDAENRLDPESAGAIDQLAAIAARTPAQRFRITAHELRGGRPEDNRAATEQRIATLREALLQRGLDIRRFDFVAGGDSANNADILSAMQRHLASCIEIEPLR